MKPAPTGVFRIETDCAGARGSRPAVFSRSPEPGGGAIFSSPAGGTSFGRATGFGVEASLDAIATSGGVGGVRSAIASLAVICAVRLLWSVATIWIAACPGRHGSPSITPVPCPLSRKFRPSGRPDAANRNPLPPRSRKAGKTWMYCAPTTAEGRSMSGCGADGGSASTTSSAFGACGGGFDGFGDSSSALASLVGFGPSSRGGRPAFDRFGAVSGWVGNAGADRLAPAIGGSLLGDAGGAGATKDCVTCAMSLRRI